MKILYGLPEPLHVTLLAKKKTQCAMFEMILLLRKTHRVAEFAKSL